MQNSKRLTLTVHTIINEAPSINVPSDGMLDINLKSHARGKWMRRRFNDKHRCELICIGKILHRAHNIALRTYNVISRIVTCRRNARVGACIKATFKVASRSCLDVHRFKEDRKESHRARLISRKSRVTSQTFRSSIWPRSCRAVNASKSLSSGGPARFRDRHVNVVQVRREAAEAVSFPRADGTLGLFASVVSERIAFAGSRAFSVIGSPRSCPVARK